VRQYPFSTFFAFSSSREKTDLLRQNNADGADSSDIRFDAILTAVYGSPTAGSAPVVPMNLNATGATFTELFLEWDAQEDTKTF
jgi:hypothetical protein